MQHLLSRAFSLRQQKEYTQALDIYDPLWKEDPVLFNDFAGWSYAYCLIKTNQYEAALPGLRAVSPEGEEKGELCINRAFFN